MTAPNCPRLQPRYEIADVRFGKGPGVGTAGAARQTAEPARQPAAEAEPPEMPPKP